MEKEKQRTFREDIDAYLARTFNRYSDLLVCAHTPKILQDIGLQDLPIMYNQKHLKNALKPKSDGCHKHGLSLHNLYRIPEALKQPVMIIDSLSQSNSICVIIDDYDSDNFPLFVAIRPETNGKYIIEDEVHKNLMINRMASVYGRDKFLNYIARAFADDKILYIDKQKSQEMFRVLQQQCTQGINILNFNGIIHPSEYFVKNNSENNQSMNMAEEQCYEEEEEYEI